MQIEALGYVGLRGPDPRAWLEYGRDILGMHVEIDPDDRIRLRMDDRRQRITIEPGAAASVGWVGWELPDAISLQRARAELEHAGVATRGGTALECAARGVSQLVAFADPSGNRVELFWGSTEREPFVAGQSTLGGFDTALGLPHVALLVPELAPAVAFYEQVMGFEECDRISGPLEARFLRINARHHSLVLFQSDRCAVDHVMVEVSDIHDVGRAIDAARAAGISPAVSLGYHAADDTISCYLPSPSGCRIEYGYVLAARASVPWGHAGLLDAYTTGTADAQLVGVTR